MDVVVDCAIVVVASLEPSRTIVGVFCIEANHALVAQNKSHAAHPFQRTNEGVFVARLGAEAFPRDAQDLRFCLGLPGLVEAVERGRVEGCSEAEPMGGMEDESCFHVDTPSGAAEVFPIVPLVEFGVCALNAAFLERPSAPTFDVRQVNAHAEE